MGIQEIKSGEAIPQYQNRKKSGQPGQFQESLALNLASQHRTAGAAAGPEGSGRLPGQARRIGTPRLDMDIMEALSTGARFNAAAQPDSVSLAEIRHISYDESDHVKISVADGYALKGRMDGDRVYVEAKYDDGRLEAYHVDPSKIGEGTQHTIERFAQETCGATDSIGFILRRMGEPQPGEPHTMEVYHKGVRVSVTRDYYKGTSITIGGSANPDWIDVPISVGTVHIDLNDIESLMKCLDMFSPEDLNAILRKITEVRQTRDALTEIDEMKHSVVESAKQDENDEENN